MDFARCSSAEIELAVVGVEGHGRVPWKATSPASFIRKKGVVKFTGPARLPDANEAGWKETERMNPGEVTSVIMKFEVPTAPFPMPVSQNPALGVSGHQFIWHCHILEHEEHDMMRPLVVRP